MRDGGEHLLSPLDRHDVATYVALESYEVGQRIVAAEGDPDEFLELCAELEAYTHAVRWLIGDAPVAVPLPAAVEVIRATRTAWERVLDADVTSSVCDPEDLELGLRRQQAFDRVLGAIDDAGRRSHEA